VSEMSLFSITMNALTKCLSPNKVFPVPAYTLYKTGQSSCLENFFAYLDRDLWLKLTNNSDSINGPSSFVIISDTIVIAHSINLL
jgi:hypothetical protein